MQCTVGAGRIPVDLENGHDSLTRVFPFTGRVPRSRNCQAALIHSRNFNGPTLLPSPLPSTSPPCNLRRYRFHSIRASILALYHAFSPRSIFKRIIFTLELTTCTVVTLVGRMRPTFVISLQEQRSDQDRSIVPLRARTIERASRV